MEIKCQLDATDDFLLQILLLAQHVSGTTMPIISSSRVLYKWLLPVVFGALVFKLSVWCGAEGYVSGLRAAARKHINGDARSKPHQIYYYVVVILIWHVGMCFVSKCRCIVIHVMPFNIARYVL